MVAGKKNLSFLKAQFPATSVLWPEQVRLLLILIYFYPLLLILYLGFGFATRTI